MLAGNKQIHLISEAVLLFLVRAVTFRHARIIETDVLHPFGRIDRGRRAVNERTLHSEESE